MADLMETVQRAGGATRDHKVVLPPDPERQPRLLNRLVSVDDHVIEAADVFVKRMPASLLDDAPRIVENERGQQFWSFEGRLLPQIGLAAVVGRAPEDWDTEPARFDEMRPGCYDPTARVKDMDIAGVDASLNFPSMIPGFAGTKFARTKNPQVGIAAVRAWNDWMFEEWFEPYPTRFLRGGITYLADPLEGVKEIHRNAARGFTAVSLPELPEPAGLPSLHTGYWDPIVRACEETDTVICLHVGSSTTTTISSSDAPVETATALFSVNSQIAIADWLYSLIPVRFPRIKIALSEGGGGWVPSFIDRADRIFSYPNMKTWGKYGTISDISPGEVIRRNFWFCAIDEPSTWKMRDMIGIENLMAETDYPHADGTWPNSQAILAAQLKDLSPAEQDLVTWKNACDLYRHTLS